MQQARPEWLITMKTKPESSLRKRLIKYLPLYILAIPSLAYLIVNNYMPMAGLVLAG